MNRPAWLIALTSLAGIGAVTYLAGSGVVSGDAAVALIGAVTGGGVGAGAGYAAGLRTPTPGESAG